MKKILFNDNYGLTQAVLAGRKTQTRRIIKDKNLNESISQFGEDRISLVYSHSKIDGSVFFGIVLDREKAIGLIEAQYKIGEVVAVAERYNEIAEKRDEAEEVLNLYKIGNKYLTMEEMGKGWNNKMFVRADLMSHHIRISNVKVERLQDISDEDCIKEGIFMDGGDDAYIPRYFYDYPNNRGDGFDTPREAYASLIDKVSGKGTWQSNPFVFVYEFELVK